MINTISLLLPKNGRPLFAGKSLLERIQFNQRYNNHSESSFIKKEEIYANIIALKVFAANLLILNSQRIQKSKETYELLIDFPLFLDAEFVHYWENEKPWKKYHLDAHILNSYEDILNGRTPSIAYCPGESAFANKIWEAFFIESNFIDIVDIIQKSVLLLESYLDNREESSCSVLEANIFDLKELFKLNDADNFTLFWTNVLFDSNLKHINKIWIDSLNINQYNTQKFFNLIESCMGIPENSILYRLTANKPLVSLSLYKALSIHNRDYDLLKENQSKDWISIWNNISTQVLRDNIRINFSLEHKTILDNLIFTNNNDIMALDNWNYLNGILNIWKTQLLEGKTKILFHGLKGCGKSSLSLSLLKTSNFNVYSPIDDGVENLKISCLLIRHLPNAALFIDNNKEFLKDEQLLKYINVNLICTLDDIGAVSKDVLNHFDYIYNLSDIPFENRLEFSKSKFLDSNLAIKIAQQLKTFGSIEKASMLISNESDWKTVYPHVNIEKGKVSKYFHVLDYNQFKDIPTLAGYGQLYNTFDNILDFFDNPHKYEHFKAKTPKGFLIEGDPGTGKTLFVKHIAKRTKLPLIVAHSPQLADNIEEISEVFNFARMSAPCILFFDEIDTLLINPDTVIGKDSKKQQLLNTMLSEIDGIKSLTGVLIIGTTNHYRQISPVALRSGRISEIISIKVPNTPDRESIWQSYFEDKPTESLDYTILSKISGGFSGADIAEAANQSALLAAYDNSDVITFQHINKACENITLGRPDGQMFVNPTELWKTAVHEVGHAVMALHYNIDVNRVTIVPRQGSLGVTAMLEKEGFYNFSKNELEQRIAVFLGGIVAEKVFFGEFQSGGSSDLNLIYKQIYSSYSNLGFSTNIGPIGTGDINTWSEDRKISIEKESTALVNKLFEETEKILSGYKNCIDLFAKELLEYRSLSIEHIDDWKNKILKKAS